MAISETNIERFYRELIHGLPKGVLVVERTILLVNLTDHVQAGCNFKTGKVYINSRALKHMHENRSPHDFDYIMKNIWAALKYPDTVYKNKPGKKKRGDFLFVKMLKDSKIYVCSVQIEEQQISGNIVLHVVTAFRNSNANYFKECESIWSWRGGTPSS